MTLVDLKKCPGLYCGRLFTDLMNGSNPWADCGACPRGYRVNILSEISECIVCKNDPSTYDWLYLGFMAMLPLILHWFFIDLAAKERWFVSISSSNYPILLIGLPFFFLVLLKVKLFCTSVHF